MDQISELTTFDNFCDLLVSCGALNSPAELHGVLCGKLCGGVEFNEQKWQEVAQEFLDLMEQPGLEVKHQIAILLQSTQAQLDSGNYDLQPYLPEDDSDLDQRLQALSEWCQGFLSGFTSANIDPNTQFPGHHADALRDLAAIVQVGVDENEDELVEQQEANYFELVEYVRVVAMSFYEDRPRTTPPSSQRENAESTLKPSLH